MATIQKGPVDEAQVKKDLKAVDEAINTLMPHLNKAHQAFGGLEDQLATMQDLKNKVAKARATYGS